MIDLAVCGGLSPKLCCFAGNIQFILLEGRLIQAMVLLVTALALERTNHRYRVRLKLQKGTFCASDLGFAR
jgi:hypothetical protein